METSSAQSEGGLYLSPGQTKVIPFQLVPQPEDVGKQLQVTHADWPQQFDFMKQSSAGDLQIYFVSAVFSWATNEVSQFVFMGQRLAIFLCQAETNPNQIAPSSHVFSDVSYHWLSKDVNCDWIKWYFFFRSQVTSIALELGSLESRCAVLVWNGGGVEASASSNKSFVSYGSKSAAKEDQFDWDDLQIVSKIKCVDLFFVFVVFFFQ